MLNRTLVAAAVLAVASLPLAAQEDVIRKNLAERLPQMPKIDEVSKTAIPGVYEVRMGTELLYSDESGNHLIQGSIFDTRSKTNVTDARIQKLTAIDFAALPLKDAMVQKQGNGSRKLAVFADPNCGYCKRFERDLATVKDVTIYTFLYPILGADSDAKAKSIWCAKDAQKTWRSWMLEGATIPKQMGQCDTAAITRNVAFGQKYKLNGTPALVFQDGRRLPGAIPAAELEKQLAEASAKS